MKRSELKDKLACPYCGAGFDEIELRCKVWIRSSEGCPEAVSESVNDCEVVCDNDPNAYCKKCTEAFIITSRGTVIGLCSACDSRKECIESGQISSYNEIACSLHQFNDLAKSKEKGGGDTRNCSTCKHYEIKPAKEPCASCKPIELTNWEANESEDIRSCFTCEHSQKLICEEPCVSCEPGARTNWEKKK